MKPINRSVKETFYASAEKAKSDNSTNKVSEPTVQSKMDAENIEITPAMNNDEIEFVNFLDGQLPNVSHLNVEPLNTTTEMVNLRRQNHDLSRQNTNLLNQITTMQIQLASLTASVDSLTRQLSANASTTSGAGMKRNALNAEFSEMGNREQGIGLAPQKSNVIDKNSKDEGEKIRSEPKKGKFQLKISRFTVPSNAQIILSQR